EALKLELEDAAAEGGEPVIPSPLVVVAGAFRRHFFDQPRPEHRLYRSVKGPGPHSDRPRGRFVDFSGDGVAMPLSTGQGEHDVKHSRRERELCIGVALSHAASISVADVSAEDVCVETEAKWGQTPFRVFEIGSDPISRGRDGRERRWTGKCASRNFFGLSHAPVPYLVSTGIPMRSLRLPYLSLRVAFVVSILPAIAGRGLAAQSPAPRATKQMQPAHLKGWKSIRQSVLSNDGKWFAYVLAPNEGDATLIVRSTGPDGKEMKYPIGEAGGAGAGRGGPPGADGGPAQSLAISADSRWVAFTIYPAASTGRAGGRGGGGRGGAGRGGAGGATQDPAAAPAQNKMGLVNLATGEKKEFDKVR